jgi:hypothetical protein
LTISDAGNWSSSFDGKGNDGWYLAGGSYLVVVQSKDSSGSTQSAQKTLAILPSTTGSLSDLRVWPDPITKEALLTFQWQPPMQARVQIYSVSGEKVADLGEGTPPLSWDMKSGSGGMISSGIYWVKLNKDGERKFLIKKFAILR